MYIRTGIGLVMLGMGGFTGAMVPSQMVPSRMVPPHMAPSRVSPSQRVPSQVVPPGVGSVHGTPSRTVSVPSRGTMPPGRQDAGLQNRKSHQIPGVKPAVSPEPEEKQWGSTEKKGKEAGLLDRTRGNWYKKKVYYTKARGLYDQIKKQAVAVEKHKAPFFKKQSETEKKYTQFNHDIDIKENKVDELLEAAQKELQEERTEEINLTEAERGLLEEVRERKRDLEQLKADIQGIAEYYELLDKAVAMVRQESSKALAYEAQAGRTYKQIATEINDRIVEQMYLSIKTNLDNITAIDTYLQNKLLPFFTGKIRDMEDKMSAAKAKVARLKSRGVIITKKIAADEEEEKKKREALQKQRAEERKRKKAAARTWYQRIWDNIKGLFT